MLESTARKALGDRAVKGPERRGARGGRAPLHYLLSGADRRAALSDLSVFTGQTEPVAGELGVVQCVSLTFHVADSTGWIRSRVMDS